MSNSFVTPWTIVHLSMGSFVHGISQSSILDGLSFPSPGYLTKPGIKPMYPALTDGSLPLSHLGSQTLALPVLDFQINGTILCQVLYIYLVAQMVKNLPAMQETWAQSLGQEDPLEKEMATNASISAWRIPWQRSPAGYSPWGHRVRHNWVTNTFTFRYI